VPPALAGLIAVEGVVLLAAGAVLFAGGLTVHHHVETVTSSWPWEITPLSSQVTGAWLPALGVAAALVLRERDLARLSVAAVTHTAVGVLQLVVVAWHLPQLATGGPWLWVHVAVLVAVTGTGAWGVRASRPGRLRGDAGSSPERAAAG
jgi:hypothetical protein